MRNGKTNINGNEVIIMCTGASRLAQRKYNAREKKKQVQEERPGDIGTGVLIRLSNGNSTYLYVNQKNIVLRMRGNTSEPYKPNGKFQNGEILKKIAENGAEFLTRQKVKELLKKQSESYEKEKNIDYELGLGTGVGNRDNRRAARNSRLMSRGQKIKR